MSAIVEVLLYLIKTATVFYTALILLRFILQLAKADFYNPISQFIVKATQPPLKYIRRIVPSLMGLDTSSIVLAILVQVAAIGAIILLFGGPILPGKILTWSILNIIGISCNIFFATVLISIVLSWVAPHTGHPAAHLIHQINEPVMAPFRRLLPSAGGIDFSPILFFVLLNVIQILLNKMAVASGMYNIVSFWI